MSESLSVVMLGASGAVGGQVVNTLLAMPQLRRLTLLARREIALPSLASSIVKQHMIDIDATDTWAKLVAGHDCAVCTFGVGESTKVSKAVLMHIDRDVVIAFATICKQAGVKHFEMLGSVGANAQSRSFYLRVKGELRDALIALNFERLSLFQPSMILTPTNRYGLSQAVTLALWPALSHLLIGPLRKFRGVRVAALGAAMAKNLSTKGRGVETLQWERFDALAKGKNM